MPTYGPEMKRVIADGARNARTRKTNLTGRWERFWKVIWGDEVVSCSICTAKVFEKQAGPVCEICGAAMTKGE